MNVESVPPILIGSCCICSIHRAPWGWTPGLPRCHAPSSATTCRQCARPCRRRNRRVHRIKTKCRLARQKMDKLMLGMCFLFFFVRYNCSDVWWYIYIYTVYIVISIFWFVEIYLWIDRSICIHLVYIAYIPVIILDEENPGDCKPPDSAILGVVSYIIFDQGC